MAFRKLQADRIFDGYRFLDDSVLVMDSEGKVEGIVPENEAGQDVEKYEGILCPGFVNVHCHLELSHMRGKIPERTGLVDFVYKVVTERHHPDEEILQAVKDAEDEMLAGGIVAVGDICNNLSTLQQKEKRRLHYYNFIEASGWAPHLAAMRFARSKEIYDSFVRQSDPHLSSNSPAETRYSRSSMVPHAPYSVSEPLWQLIAPYFENRVVTIHNQEAPFEDEFFLEATGDFLRMYQLMKIDNSHHQPGTSSVRSYFHRFEKARNILMVHNTFIRQEDLEFISEKTQSGREVFFCLCVNANQFIENALPPIDLLRATGRSLVLGTDSLASNHSLSIADEINTIRRHFPAIPLEEILQWGTLNGARALQMQERLGSFEKGKIPGVVWLRENENRLEAKKLV